ncbi:hypothetical protein EHE19_000475 [Ruminiclostridium herbifermentans]|uniref:Uncharacterized protein n=1 Tax=Ruminiclostridium herbifermentans TaxID=2488810 RepID=A0A4U7JGN2_9FIRM|nr:hypothetical protein [Ruminiclostridium herbifermentans]QNU67070.1 hypothetical protein EHE19_000475 [Ruminiclostridium herbifermentans]
MKFFEMLIVLIKATFRTRSNNFSRGRMLNVFLAIIAILFGSSILVEEFFAYELLNDLFGTKCIIQSVFILCSAMSVIFTFPIAVSNVFYSKDYQLLSCMPVKKEKIIFTKVCVSYLYIVPINLIIAIPGFIVACLYGSLSILQCLWALCILLIYPIFLVSLVGILAWLIVKGDVMIKNRGLIVFGSNLLFFAGVIVLSLLLNSIIYPILANFEIDSINVILKKWMDFSNSIVLFFKPIGFAVSTILEMNTLNGVLSFILLILLNIIFSSIFVCIAASTYSSFGEKLLMIPERVKRLKTFSIGGKTGRLFQREWWILNNEFFFIAEGLTELFIGPLLILIFSLFTVFSHSIIPQFEQVFLLIQDFKYLDLVLVIMFVFLSTMSTIGPTGISREGKNFYISKVIPIPYSTQYFVKLLFSTLFALGSCVISFAGLLLLGLNMKHPLLVLISALSLIILIETGTLFFDMVKPNLTWNHPRQALNSNTNVALNMLWVFVVVGVFIGMGFIGVFLNIRHSIILVSLTVISLVSSFVVGKFLRNKAENFYMKIEI